MDDIQTSLHANRQAVQAFLASARAVPAARWDLPRAEGKWSPAQVAEHVALGYEAARDVLRGRAPGAGAPPRLLRPLIRAFLLRPVLWLGRFPAASKAPAELQPGACPGVGVLDRLRAAAEAFESEAAAARSASIDHPAFGRLPLVDLVRLQEIHTKHHHAQLPS